MSDKPHKRTGWATDRGMTEEVRAEIVTRLACYDTARDIHADLQERGIDISPQAVGAYNPEIKVFNKGLKWRDLFHTTRERFLQEIAAEPIAHRAYRLRQLQKIHEKELAAGNLSGARATLEQAAKENGNVFTNVQKVFGSVKGVAAMPDQTSEERRNMLADRVAEAMRQLPSAAGGVATKH